MTKKGSSSRSSRGYSNRSVDRLQPIPKFLIVCEGEKTEKYYFEKFPVPTRPKVIVKGIGYVTLSLVKETIELVKNEDIKIGDGYEDQVWCVFDRDFKKENFNAQNYNSAIALAQKSEFHVAFSNDAFELWYILHFEYYESETHREDYAKLLEKRLGHKYEKNSETMYEELLDKQPKAIQHAKKLLERYDPDMTGNHNPSTTVYLLVKELNKFMRR
ncbi:RloB family protein [Tumidithrix elongata RA019]|uniref:RloB family protein n=1 Tax=Tumidithrix elongata BACA0141 TaxID=2716417 RepID=A0AAW9PU28_9CYAN|nr:RloB family protein [Tumidithrix elongata RA019]